MEEKDYTAIISDKLTALGAGIDALKTCLFSHDKRRLKDVESKLKESIKAELPVIEELMKKPEKHEADRKFLTVLPSLQKLAIAVEDLMAAVRSKIETETSFTEKALGEVSEIMALTKDLARDTNDMLHTRNPRFQEYVKTAAQHIRQRADDCDPEHQKRLIECECTPKGSFLYLDMMQSLKRIAKELSYLADKA
jgi:Na+/phosphate symporter